MYKRSERLRHLYRASIRFLAETTETLWNRGVRKLCIGYLIMLSQEKWKRV
ncbi:MAG: hypothetical protein RQ885_03020 [Desulfurococcales archaeon]|nr:hypothetical protein [Desulfurococcales archaeon]